MDGAALPEGQRVLGTPGLVTDGEVTAAEGAGRAQGWISFGKWENAAKLISSLSWRGRPELCAGGWGRAEIPGDIPASRSGIAGGWMLAPPRQGTATECHPPGASLLWHHSWVQGGMRVAAPQIFPWKAGSFPGDCAVPASRAARQGGVGGSFFFSPAPVPVLAALESSSSIKQ